MRPLAPVLAAVAAFAGCIAPAPAATSSDVAPAATALDAPVDVLEWEGWIKVSVYREAPAHLTPSDRIVDPLWRAGYVIEIVEVPRELEVELDWTSATPTRMNFMVHAPHGAERPEEKGWSEYTTESPGVPEGPLCIRIPAADLMPGHWYPMAHSAYGADIRLVSTVRSVGGVVEITDEHPHGHETNAEEVLNLVETQIEEHRAWEPCVLAG